MSTLTVNNVKTIKLIATYSIHPKIKPSILEAIPKTIVAFKNLSNKDVKFINTFKTELNIQTNINKLKAKINY